MNASHVDWVGRARSCALRIENFIGGRFRPGSGVQTLAKYSPRDGRVLGRFGAGERGEIEEAVENARCAFADGRWSRKSVQSRSDILHRLAVLIEKRREELALFECLDVGKPISDTWGFDVPAAAATVRYSAEAADKLYGKVYGTEQTSLSFELRRPLGVVGAIVGWNFPLLLAAQKIGPALATGNCIVLKPSEFTPVTASRLAELAIEAGVPEGVFNVVHGDPSAGSTLAHHAQIDLLTFTGSTRTGKALLIASGQSNMKRLVLECGGKAPNIVFEDCPDLEAVADGIIASAFWNQGQVCVASSRVLIQRSIKEELLSLLMSKASRLVPGDPLLAETRFGALVSESHKQKVLRYIESGGKEGAKMVYRGQSEPPFADGFYVAPVIFDEVLPNQKIAQEEIFGPVLAVMAFDAEEDAIRMANATVYGLSATIWTRDLGRAHRLSQAIDAGWIVINATATPTGGLSEGALVGGGHKQSGMGVEGGVDGLEAYTCRSTVQVFV